MLLLFLDSLAISFHVTSCFWLLGYKFEHEVCFTLCHSDSSYSWRFSPWPCSDVCCVPTSILYKPSWLVTYPDPLPSCNLVLIRVHSSGKAGPHSRKVLALNQTTWSQVQALKLPCHLGTQQEFLKDTFIKWPFSIVQTGLKKPRGDVGSPRN